MSEIQNIDFSLYSLYAFTDEKAPFKLEFRIDSGYMEYVGYDSFEIESGTIICFKKDTFDGFHDVRITGDKVSFIQLSSNDKILKTILNENNSDGYNFYLFLDSVIQETSFIFDESWNLDQMNIPASFSRCDYRKLGGVGFYLGSAGYDVIDVFYVLNITGIGHILRVETSNDGNLNQNQGIYAASRTLAGMLKTIYEWSIVAKEPFNNQEKISTSAVLFLENLNLNEDVMSDILSSTGDMLLARYIKGDTERSLEKETASIYYLPESFKNYIKYYYSYSDFYEMNKTLELNIFDENISNGYLNYFGKIIFDFFYEKGVDVENFENLDEVEESDLCPPYMKKTVSKYKQAYYRL
jgi:hypothetical protein